MRVTSPNFIITAARDLFPGYFAMVMATGALSVAANLMGMRAVSVPLLAVNVVVFATLWSLTLLRAALFFPRIIADLKDHARGPGFFTLVAGTCVFGTQCLVVGRSPVVARALWALGSALWLVVMYAFYRLTFIRLPFMLVVPRGFIFVALIVWTGTFVGLLLSLYRAWATRAELPAAAAATDAGPQFPA
jgi:tellurite resistance protein TehA-like permease